MLVIDFEALDVLICLLWYIPHRLRVSYIREYKFMKLVLLNEILNEK